MTIHDPDWLPGLVEARRLLVATDFDGVLAPIVADPAAAAAIPEAMTTLRTLASLPDTMVAVVSGRSYDQLAELMAPVGSFILAGSHGAELRDETMASPDRSELDHLVDDLQALADRVPGLHIEVKSLSAAVHYRRLADRERGAEVEARVEELATRWPGKVIRGKEVVEFTLGHADKGDAVRLLAERNRVDATLYFGDDVTDEDVFAVLGPSDAGVKVGPGETQARHRLASPQEVTEALAELLRARSRRQSVG